MAQAPNTRSDGLTYPQWMLAHEAARIAHGLNHPSADSHVSYERYELNEDPVEMAVCDRARVDRLAEGWTE